MNVPINECLGHTMVWVLVLNEFHVTNLTYEITVHPNPPNFIHRHICVYVRNIDLCNIISNIRCLVIRMEDLAKSESVIADFLSLPSFSLMPTNRAEKKAYSSAYSNFKEKVAIPEEYINKMYNSKYTRHFYSDSEITKFKQKWCA